jgi:hypothetical protein
MSKQIIVPYEKIRPNLQTFDIINCVYGTQWWNPFHWLMAAVGHTACVYRCHETDQVMIYESTTMGRNDKKTGVQLRPMREWLRSYPGKVYVRHVTFDIDWSRTYAERRCRDHIIEYRGTEYPNLKKWRWRWFVANAAIDLPWTGRLQKALENPDIDEVMFCTMLILHLLRWCDLVPRVTLPSEWQPDDVRGLGGLFDKLLKVAGALSIGPEIRIK